MQVTRKCQICGAEYTIDSSDTTPLCHDCYIKANDTDHKYIWLQTGRSIEVLVPVSTVKSIATTGSNDQAVENALTNPFIYNQFTIYSHDCIKQEFQDIGLDKDTDDLFEMVQYLLWNMCWNCVDDGEIDDRSNWVDEYSAVYVAFNYDLVYSITENDQEYVVRGNGFEENIKVIYFEDYDENGDFDAYELDLEAIETGVLDGSIIINYKELEL